MISDVVFDIAERRINLNKIKQKKGEETTAIDFQTSMTVHRSFIDTHLQNYSHKCVTPEPLLDWDCSWWKITPSDCPNYTLGWWSFKSGSLTAGLYSGTPCIKLTHTHKHCLVLFQEACCAACIIVHKVSNIFIWWKGAAMKTWFVFEYLAEASIQSCEQCEIR